MEIFTSHMPVVFKMIMLIEERANQRIYLKYPDFFIVCLISLEFSCSDNVGGGLRNPWREL